MSLISPKVKTQHAEVPYANQSHPAIDCAYAVKIFLDHYPDCSFQIISLACQCGISETQLKDTFLLVFHEQLDQYLEKAQWRALGAF